MVDDGSSGPLGEHKKKTTLEKETAISYSMMPEDQENVFMLSGMEKRREYI